MEHPGRPIVVMRPGVLVEGVIGAAPSLAPPGAFIAGGPFLAYVVHGEGWLDVAGESTVLRPGMLVSAPAGPVDCMMTDEHEIVIMTMRESADGARDVTNFTLPLARQLSAHDGEAWRERMLEMLALAEDGRVRDEHVIAVKRDLVPLLWLKRAPYAQETLYAIYRRLWERPSEPVSLSAIAEQVGYTPNYLNDLARVHTGRSLGKWIADIRMTRARYELEHTSRPVAEVGAACGYDDPAYFSRAFRRSHGVPPALWRLAKSPDGSERGLSVSVPEFKHYGARNRKLLATYSFAS